MHPSQSWLSQLLVLKIPPKVFEYTAYFLPRSYINWHIINVWAVFIFFQCEVQVPCFLTQTNAATHKIVADNVHLNRHVLEEVTGPRSDFVVCG